MIYCWDRAQIAKDAQSLASAPLAAHSRVAAEHAVTAAAAPLAAHSRVAAEHALTAAARGVCVYIYILYVCIYVNRYVCVCV